MIRSILLGGGCFWCTESVFGALKGVQSVVSGYAGGSADTANYQAVCTGTTGHVEVVQVVYDDAIISLEQILAVFLPPMIRRRRTAKAMTSALNMHR